MTTCVSGGIDPRIHNPGTKGGE